MLHSFLYVPGDRPDLMSKAVTSGAHAMILDLEDGVAPSNCVTARTSVADFLRSQGRRTLPVAVRVHTHPDRIEGDLLVAAVGGADMVYLPKAELASVERCRAMLDDADRSDHGVGLPIVALIETAQGWLEAPALARSAGVVGLALGEADLFAELGMDPDLPESERQSIRLRLVVASAAAGRRGPTAPASTDFTDLDSFRASCVALRRRGFVARSAVHPAQVPIINEVFAPSEDELDRARQLVADFDAAVAQGRAVTLGADGRMIDEAVVRSARRLLA